MYKYGEVEMQAMIRAEFERVHYEACKLFPSYALRGKPALTFFNMGATAGWAKSGPWRVEINLHIARQNWEMTEDTISHEIAHLVEFAIAKKMSHSPRWKAIHRALGGNGQRCYNAREEGVKVQQQRRTKQHQYILDDGVTVLWINTPTHNKIQQGSARRHIATKQPVRASHYTGKAEFK